jgi:hypothetical protein
MKVYANVHHTLHFFVCWLYKKNTRSRLARQPYSESAQFESMLGTAYLE